MFFVQNGFYLAVMAAAAIGMAYNQSNNAKARSEAVKVVQDEREKAIKATVGRYVVDPATGSTSFEYGK